MIKLLIIWTIPILFAIIIHEVSHGWAANKLGDHTAFMLGRITLNPIKHIDLVGTIIVPLLLLWAGGFVFGWAKPVPVNHRNLKNLKRDMALVAAAGPCSNLVMALFWALIAKFAILTATEWVILFYYMGMAGISINLILAILNLIPIPPLDGSRILASFLPPKLAYSYSKIEPYGFFILLAMLMFNVLGIFIGPPYYFLQNFITSVFNLP